MTYPEAIVQAAQIAADAYRYKCNLDAVMVPVILVLIAAILFAFTKLITKVLK